MSRGAARIPVAGIMVGRPKGPMKGAAGVTPALIGCRVDGDGILGEGADARADRRAPDQRVRRSRPRRQPLKRALILDPPAN